MPLGTTHIVRGPRDKQALIVGCETHLSNTSSLQDLWLFLSVNRPAAASLIYLFGQHNYIFFMSCFHLFPPPLPTPDVKSHCCTATSILFPIFLTFTSDSPSCRLIFQHEICGIGRYFKLSCVMAGCTGVTVLTIRVGATEESVGSLDELSSHHRCYVEKKSRRAVKPELFGRELSCVL